MPIHLFHIRLTEHDQKRIALIREEFGLISEAAALRQALIIATTPEFISKKSRKKVSEGA